MSPRWILAAAVAVAACHSDPAASTKDSTMRTYKLVPANNSSAAPVSVSLAVPSSWKENLSNPSTPRFDVPGLGGGSMVSLTAIEVTGSPADQMTKAIDLQDLTDGQRTNLSGNRAWVQKTEGSRVHGRVFVPYAGGVVMGIAMTGSADKVPELRAVFETMTVGGR